MVSGSCLRMHGLRVNFAVRFLGLVMQVKGVRLLVEKTIFHCVIAKAVGRRLVAASEIAAGGGGVVIVDHHLVVSG